MLENLAELQSHQLGGGGVGRGERRSLVPKGGPGTANLPTGGGGGGGGVGRGERRSLVLNKEPGTANLPTGVGGSGGVPAFF